MTVQVVAPSGLPLNLDTTTIVNPNATPDNGLPPAGSPEYNAHMIALGEGKDPAAAVAALKAQSAEQPKDAPTEPPRLTDEPAPKEGDEPPKEQPKQDEPPKEGDEPPKEEPQTERVSLKTEFDDGTFLNEFNAEKPSDSFLKKVADALGVEGDAVSQMAAQFRAGQMALQREAVTTLHTAAGGKEQFESLVKWGQANLSKEQKSYYDKELNGPNASEAIGVLMNKMNAGRDPSLINVNGGSSSALAAFRDQSEMISAMQDPRYQSSEAYRREVTQRVALMR